MLITMGLTTIIEMRLVLDCINKLIKIFPVKKRAKENERRNQKRKTK